MKLAPIVLFIYNRPKHTELTLNALAANRYAVSSELHIFADGPKQALSKMENQLIAQAREVAKNIKGFKSVTLYERDINIGLAESIFRGVSYVLEKKGEAIILEDDMITSRFFLEYMNEGLRLFEQNKQIGSINAYAEDFLKEKKFPEYLLLEGADCWGWATWKDRWAGFNLDAESLKSRLLQAKRMNAFEYGPHLSLLNLQIENKIDTWDVQWHGFNVLNHRKGVFPRHSFVENIGLDGSGTHGDVFSLTGNVKPKNLNLYTFKLAAWNANLHEDDMSGIQKRYKNFYSKKHNIFLLTKIIRKIVSLKNKL